MSDLGANNTCKSFEAHNLRPEKCRKCFGDKSRHYESVEESAANIRQQTTSVMVREDISQMAALNESTMSKEQLLVELKKCHEEKGKLNKELASFAEKDEQICKYKREIEKLKLDIRKSGKSSLVGGEGISSIGNDNEQQDKIKMDQQQQIRQIEELKNKCNKLEIERDSAIEELKTLEKEMEEMHDNFKEDESEQFEQVKQELDLANKNCKILQIRLNKSERQYNQLEQVKSMLERQLEETNRQQEQINKPQKQLKTISEQQNPSSYFTQISQDSVKLSTSEYDQLLRDLNDTIEREKDLQEQIKYSQEEAQLKSDKLQAVEAENEVLLKKINKLTFANSRLRSFQSTQRSTEQQKSISGDQQTTSDNNTANNPKEDDTEVACDLIEQNEQLKLALDLTQSESDRLKIKVQQLNELLELKDNSLKEADLKRVKLEQEFLRFKALRRATSFGQPLDSDTTNENSKLELKASNEQINKLEFECRQLRTKLVHSERECKQLKSQLEQLNLNIENMENSGRKSRQSSLNTQDSRQISREGSFENHRQLIEQIEQFRTRNSELEQKLQILTGGEKMLQGSIPSGGQMESDLLEKLKRQLDSSESELAKSKSRLVELDVELNRIQRQYKRLVESLEENVELNSIGRRNKLPPETMRDSMSRQELRQALKSLDEEIEELLVTIRAKDCLIRELKETNSTTVSSTASNHSPSEEEMQVRSLHRLIDQERLLSNNLKIDVKNLEKSRNELQLKNRMLERERAAMEEETDKLRQVNRELNVNLEDMKKNYRISSNKLKELQVDYEKLKIEYLAVTKSSSGSKNQQQQQQQQQQIDKNRQESNSWSQDSQIGGDSNTSPGGGSPNIDGETTNKRGTSSDLLLMARDLSELKVKNGFLMRQLEIVREDTVRQLDDLRRSNEDQTRRAIELAQIKLKEKHLIELQNLRDELNDSKQKLAASQRLVARNDEEVSSERDKLRSMERDWRRDKSNWQQRIEQLEAQLTIEKRSNEYRVKEFESLMREKERELIGIQDKYVQLERDFKRLQNKYNLLEDNSETKEKNLIRELEIKKREFSELMVKSQSREDEYYEKCKRFNGEKATLLEALESIKRSYDEKLVECKSVRELLLMRQDQAYRERINLQEKIDSLNNQLIKLSEYETQSKLLKQQIQMQDKQQESIKREYLQLKEEKMKLKTRCDDLERRCNQYEKQELISKTSSISSSTNIFSKARNSFVSNNNNLSKQVKAGLTTTSKSSYNNNNGSSTKQQDQSNNNNMIMNELELENNKKNNAQLVEKLTSKINDQRNLINMLKQQHDETQMELKQLKLLNLADKSKWQIQVNQLKSQLAGCEERLLFESSNLLSSETFDNSRRKLEIKWGEERSTMLEMIKQQQASNELLMKDLKKLTQSHDMLRLQSKQIESHNNKLSRKLIEYQQQKATDPFASRLVKRVENNLGDNKSGDLLRQLDNCLSSKRDLESKQELLLRKNDRMKEIFHEQVEPLIEIVAKIMASLESSQSQVGSEKKIGSSSPANISDETKSTQRPLLTGREHSPDNQDDVINATISTTTTTPQQSPGSRLSRFLGTTSNKLTSSGGDGKATTKNISLAAVETKTNVKRVKIKSAAIGITPTEKKQLKRNLQELSSTLENLNNNSAFERSSTRMTTKNNKQQQPERASSELTDREQPPLVLDRYKQRGVSHTPTRSLQVQSDTQRVSFSPNSGQHSNYGPDLDKRRSSNPQYTNQPAQPAYQQQSSPLTQSRVHWHFDYASDCDSEKSWSQLDSGSAGGDNGGGVFNPTNSSSNYYKRFPQTMPSSYYKASSSNSTTNRDQVGASFTDCDSESSLAPSDYSSYSSSHRKFVSGTESDSCMTTGTSSKVSRKGVRSKSSGLKLRLTSTLRNISRSISGLTSNTSDSEQETTQSSVYSRSKLQQQREMSRKTEIGNEFGDKKNRNNNCTNDEEDEENQDSVVTKLKEIRV